MDSSFFVEPDDDGEFDWEAAVREIDVACQGSISISNEENLLNVDSVEILGKGYKDGKACHVDNKSIRSRQSTLDSFVNLEGKCREKQTNSATHESYEHKIIDNCEKDEKLYPKIDLEAAKVWIYPVNVPLRDYQLSITRTALFSNTLVALPTGLGKTLIAAVVMYNYFRWFPEGKIVFTAPSRPLVIQQIEACHNIVGMPQECTIDMTGQTSPSCRSRLWKEKRVFFVTPQVLEKDIQSGICLANQMVCLVIDEAHRAQGNYSYSVVVRELMAIPVKLRILALTATPGSKQQSIQDVINNLHISMLEYRNENHPEVRPYVHNRKLELIEVPMGKVATEVNNLLLEAIRPYMSKLCSIGVLPNRNFATFSPCDLLNSRDKFRQAPPLNLPQTTYGEVEGYFGGLITLYYVRKLLTSHGIKPAYDMLEGKMQQGSFARIMCRNEAIHKAKVLMQKSISHGAPNPKLSKLMEVLVEHFKTKDPKDSRVIIFSNYRGSVKDIMDSLSNIKDLVKATEFVGQSSGRTSKGQPQKVQQAVLQKFRAGGYNCIVATSIGEEGLDIMEVDLVICFDANVSPLRMIQRMGRTGRKHDGRVVVLACEGSELKAYLRKQEDGKSVKKHMHNGGINSFNFHSSPRMVPHVCQSQVQFLELAIEQYVPRGKKVKPDLVHKPSFESRLSDSEMDILSRYFEPGKSLCKPSLIAFPHFQAFPSRIYKVKHSFKTRVMLIGSLQFLHETNQNLLSEVEVKVSSTVQHLETMGIISVDSHSNEPLPAGNTPNVSSPNKASIEEVCPRDILMKVEPLIQDNHTKTFSYNCKTSDGEGSLTDTSMCTNAATLENSQNNNSSFHQFLFGEDLVSVCDDGRVVIKSVPNFQFLKDASRSDYTKDKSTMSLNSALQDTSGKDLFMTRGNLSQFKDTVCIENVLEQSNINDCQCSFHIPSPYVPHVPELDKVEELVPQTPELEVKLATSEDFKSAMSGCRSKDELSPRLTNFMEKGIVPESPMLAINQMIPGSGPWRKNSKLSYSGGTHVSCEIEETGNMMPSPSNLPGKKNIYEYVSTDIVFNVSSLNGSSTFEDTCAGTLKYDEEKGQNRKLELGYLVFREPLSPLDNQGSGSCSDDWKMNASANAESISIQRPHKFKRLCKSGDKLNLSSMSILEERQKSDSKCDKSLTKFKSTSGNHHPDRWKPGMQAISFIEEEAEVSSDADVSEDEDDSECNDNDDSFIDDRADPTQTTPTGQNSIDVMAIYRHSLLSQSPLEDQYKYLTGFKDGPISPKTIESCHPSKGMMDSTQNISTTARNAPSFDKASSFERNLIKDSKVLSQEDENKMIIRKRKLSFVQVSESSTDINLQSKNNEVSNDVFYDDEFYESLDFDEVEAQATKLLENKINFSTTENQSRPITSGVPPQYPGQNSLNLPSFDLGI